MKKETLYAAMPLVAAAMAGFYEEHADGTAKLHLSAVDQARDCTKEEVLGGEYLYSMVASWGTLLAQLQAVDIAAPGVFAYDVAEKFGAWLYRQMVTGGAVPTGAACEGEITSLAVAHLCRDGMAQDTAAAIVANVACMVQP